IVAELWSQVSQIPDPGVHDDFFAAGGDSITAIRLIGSVRDAFEVEISFRRFFEAPTVAGLAGAVEDAIRAEIEQMSHDELLAYDGDPGP
ncbi:MAG TPA: acyl carrier protein, partial [Trebonia sp.]